MANSTSSMSTSVLNGQMRRTISLTSEEFKELKKIFEEFPECEEDVKPANIEIIIGGSEQDETKLNMHQTMDCHHEEQNNIKSEYEREKQQLILQNLQLMTHRVDIIQQRYCEIVKAFAKLGEYEKTETEETEEKTETSNANDVKTVFNASEQSNGKSNLNLKMEHELTDNGFGESYSVVGELVNAISFIFEKFIVHKGFEPAEVRSMITQCLRDNSLPEKRDQGTQTSPPAEQEKSESEERIRKEKDNQVKIETRNPFGKELLQLISQNFRLMELRMRTMEKRYDKILRVIPKLQQHQRKQKNVKTSAISIKKTVNDRSKKTKRTLKVVFGVASPEEIHVERYIAKFEKSLTEDKNSRNDSKFNAALPDACSDRYSRYLEYAKNMYTYPKSEETLRINREFSHKPGPCPVMPPFKWQPKKQSAIATFIYNGPI